MSPLSKKLLFYLLIWHFIVWDFFNSNDIHGEVCQCHVRGSYAPYKIVFKHQSLMHQWRLPPKNLRCKSPWISCRRTKNQFLMHQWRFSLKSPRFKNWQIHMLMIQESKMQAPTILMALESNEVLRIQEHSKVQRTNETLKVEEPMKAQEFEWNLKIYEEGTFMCMRLLVKEKCMNMMIRMSLRYWFIGISHLMKIPTTTTPCGQGVLKGRECRIISP